MHVGAFVDGRGKVVAGRSKTTAAALRRARPGRPRAPASSSLLRPKRRHASDPSTPAAPRPGAGGDGSTGLHAAGAVLQLVRHAPAFRARASRQGELVARLVAALRAGGEKQQELACGILALLGENDDEAETVDDDLVNMAVSMQARVSPEFLSRSRSLVLALFLACSHTPAQTRAKAHASMQRQPPESRTPAQDGAAELLADLVCSSRPQVPPQPRGPRTPTARARPLRACSSLCACSSL